MDSRSEISFSDDDEIHELLMQDSNLNEINKELLKRDNKKLIDKQINYKNASIFSRIFFNWSKLAMRISNKGILKTSDVCALTKDQSTRYNIANLQKYYNKYTSEKRRYPLFQSIFVIHMKLIMYLFFLNAISIILEYTGIYFFAKILDIFRSGEFFLKKKFWELFTKPNII